MAWKLFGWSVI